MSLHDDGLLHGSLANNSDRVRCGITMRFAPVNVKANLSIWPHFETQLARGMIIINTIRLQKFQQVKLHQLKNFNSHGNLRVNGSLKLSDIVDYTLVLFIN